MEYLLIFILSLVASFIFSLGGVGAAIILIPILVSLGIPIDIARPTGLFYNTVSLASASINNIKNKRLNYKLGIPIIVSSFIFASFGAYISKYIPNRIILLLFIAFLLFSSSMFLMGKGGKKEGKIHNIHPYISLSFVGSFAGLLSGLLGVGGGAIISPLMLLLGYDAKEITTITAFVVPFSSFSGFITYWLMGKVVWSIVLVSSLGGVIGAYLGTSFMHNKLDTKVVKKILGVILLLIAIKLLLKVI